LGRNTPLSAMAALSAAATLTVAFGVPPADAKPGAASGSAWWCETFERPPLDFLDPFGHSPLMLARVYSIGREDTAVLRARHDGVTGAVPAMHYGKPFPVSPPPLERVRALRWRWRVLRHPDVERDSWADLAASVYVVVREPTLLHGGRGFKFGWVAKPALENTYQHGLLQSALRTGGSLGEWRSESVDLCALYRRAYGECEGEHVRYVGVMTDGDATRSIAEAEYDDFGILAAP
jgi:hypothetical protein